MQKSKTMNPYFNPQMNMNMMQQMYMMNPMMMQQFQQQQQMNQMQNGNKQQNQTGKYKTQLCRHFQSGNCQLGNTCHFAHGQADLRTSNDPLPQNIPQLQAQKMNVNNFKTQKCKYYEQGNCKNGANCSYAHGEELRTPQGNMGGYPQQQNQIINSLKSILPKE
ncbi:hypothetical protein PPERSA_06769 [Pseudocohnilembus persalinus]|uniref:C3H1-type domain-containing protein n=1 Tax=Pseudocohnilembus persalinus TaxID=266149 RepID=A0A0V0QS82_PSEPJ|nr:hypothetical protein PPERSA_06769 [Pseudocohnilembus persalinus]|eukprot:KRX05135.1 hypothetical protein PPERSA_06769 [Pseudocohnilembus persalinus]